MKRAITIIGILAVLLGGTWFFGRGRLWSTGNPRVDLGDTAPGDRWAYEDWEAARLEAERTGKPIFALFRCVP